MKKEKAAREAALAAATAETAENEPKAEELPNPETIFIMPDSLKKQELDKTESQKDLKPSKKKSSGSRKSLKSPKSSRSSSKTKLKVRGVGKFSIRTRIVCWILYFSSEFSFQVQLNSITA